VGWGGTVGGGGIPYGTTYRDPRYHHHFAPIGNLAGTPGTTTHLQHLTAVYRSGNMECTEKAT